ncbi:MAG: glycosyltransferase family 2 protein [Candidatus Cloacimonetes bacterium]|nr:glycosyltransferase family 2 protein [Candidatus Cloacimonadota bacterium]
MLPSRPLISVIMPIHNTRPFLEQAIASVVAQTCPDWELILVDDASTDGSAELAQAWARRDARLRWARNGSRLGAAATMNHGITLASGEFLCFLGSDDVYHPRKLELQLEHMLAHGCSFSQTGHHRCSEDLGLWSLPILPAERVVHGDLTRINRIASATVMLRAAAYPDLAYPDWPARADYVLWLRLLSAGGSVCGIRHSLYGYRQRSGAISRSSLLRYRLQWKILREELALSPPKASWSFLAWLVAGVMRRGEQRLRAHAPADYDRVFRKLPPPTDSPG